MNCTKCKNPLSISPIWTQSDSYICGRCIPDGKNRDSSTSTETISDSKTTNLHRNIAYESIASTTKHPCKNHTLGCTELLYFNAVEHEANCTYNNKDETNPTNILHCDRSESVSSLKQTCDLKLHKFGGLLREAKIKLLTEELNTHHWYIYEQQRFKFIVHTGVMDERLFFDIGLVGARRTADQITYRVILGGPEGRETFVALNVANISTNMKFDLGDWKTVDYASLLQVLDNRDSAEIYCHLSITIPPYVRNDYSTNLKTITCPKCQLVMTAPIYQCSDGHSACEDCVDERDQVGWCYACPQVDYKTTAKLNQKAVQRFSGANDLDQPSQKTIRRREDKRRVCVTRNLDMEIIAKWVVQTPCRWPQCNTITATIRRHERECPYRLYNCSWWCKYSGVLDDVKTHLVEEHGDKKLFSDGEACINGTEASCECIVIANRDLFTVTMSSSSDTSRASFVGCPPGRNFYVCYKAPKRSLISEYSCEISLRNMEKFQRDYKVPFYTKFDIPRVDFECLGNGKFYIIVKIVKK